MGGLSVVAMAATGGVGLELGSAGCLGCTSVVVTIGSGTVRVVGGWYRLIAGPSSLPRLVIKYIIYTNHPKGLQHNEVVGLPERSIR